MRGSDAAGVARLQAGQRTVDVADQPGKRGGCNRVCIKPCGHDPGGRGEDPIGALCHGRNSSLVGCFGPHAVIVRCVTFGCPGCLVNHGRVPCSSAIECVIMASVGAVRSPRAVSTVPRGLGAYRKDLKRVR